MRKCDAGKDTVVGAGHVWGWAAEEQGEGGRVDVTKGVCTAFMAPCLTGTSLMTPIVGSITIFLLPSRLSEWRHCEPHHIPPFQHPRVVRVKALKTIFYTTLRLRGGWD